jgi:hypothetical protein
MDVMSMCSELCGGYIGTRPGVSTYSCRAGWVQMPAIVYGARLGFVE